MTKRNSKLPRIVIVVNPEGIEATRIVAHSLNEEAEGKEVLEKILPVLEDINTLCRGRGTE